MTALRAGVALSCATIVLSALGAAAGGGASAASTTGGPAAAPPGGPAPQWIVEGPGDQNALAAIQGLDPALAQKYFDNDRSYILAGDAQPTEPPADEVPPGWPAVPAQHYTSFGPCPVNSGGVPQPGCASFSGDIGSGALTGSGIRAVMYDDENWTKTPAAEKTGVCSYMKQFAQLAHANQLMSIMAPDQNLASPGVITSFQGGESTDWQSYLRLGLANCAAASGTDLYHIMSQPFETPWCGGQGAACEGSEADYTDFVTQAALQAKSVNPNIGLTAGLSTSPRYNVTPQAMYQDSLDVSRLVPGVWLNVAGNPANPATAVQYLEMRSGLLPLYPGDDGALSRAFPTAAQPASMSLATAGAQSTFVSSQTDPAGTVIPAGSYTFEPWTDSGSGSATVSVEVGYCTPPGCTDRVPIIGDGAWPSTVPAGDPGVVSSFTTRTPTTLPPGGPYSIYVTVHVDSPGPVSLLSGTGSDSTNVAVPRPSSEPATPRTSVVFAQPGMGSGTGPPAGPTARRFSLARPGNTVTFSTGQVLRPGTVVPAGPWEFQYWTDGTGGPATLGLQAGYCSQGCTERYPIVGSSAGWQATVAAGAEGAADPGGAFTTTSPTQLPASGGPYRLYWTVTVESPGAFNLLYDSAGAPTSLATPLALPSGG
jgi:hypothetical protein